MGPVNAEVEIDVPRERAFAFIADLANRPAFTDHFISGFHLTRIESAGVGAGARFRVDVPLGSSWTDTVIAELEPPHRIVERGCGGRGNRVRSTTVWELTGAAGSLTRVRLTRWTESSHPLDRLRDALPGTSRRHQRRWREALRRLRDALESEAALAAPVAIAGGNPHATGIP